MPSIPLKREELRPPKEPEQGVIVRFQYGKPDIQPIHDLEDRLKEAIEAANVGEFDGNAVAGDGSHGYLYMYGPDADRLFAVVLPVLESSDFMQGATVTLQYGPPERGVRQSVKTIGR